VLETIALDEIDSKGYAFQIETTFRARACRLPRVEEIPIAVHRSRQGSLEDEPRRSSSRPVWKVPLLRLRRPGRAPVTWRSSVRDGHRRELRGGRPPGRSACRVVDLLGPWCGPCHARAPGARAARDESESVEFVKLDIDQNPVTASRYGVLSIPTVISSPAARSRRPSSRPAPPSIFRDAFASYL
jgi:hypothetical protein